MKFTSFSFAAASAFITLGHSYYYLDDSCQKYEDLVIDGMKDAFQMVEEGVNVFNTLDALGTSNTISDTHTAQRDLMTYIFNEALTNGNVDATKSAWIKALDTLRLILLKYDTKGSRLPEPIPTTKPYPGMSSDDIVIYCTYDRYEENKLCDKTVNGKVVKGPYSKGDYCDTSIGAQGKMSSLYKSCKSPSFFRSMTIEALTTVYKGNQFPTVVQLCPDYIKKMQKAKVTNTAGMGKKFNLAKIGDWLNDPTRTSMDVVYVFAATLVHEMTHAVPNHETDDDGYGWKNVRKLSNAGGIDNADSYAFFCLGARLISLGQRPMADGSIKTLPSPSSNKRDILERAPTLDSDKVESNITLILDHAAVTLNTSNMTGFIVSAPKTTVTVHPHTQYTIGTDLVSLNSSFIVYDHSTIFVTTGESGTGFPGASYPNNLSTRRPSTFSTSPRPKNSSISSLSRTHYQNNISTRIPSTFSTSFPPNNSSSSSLPGTQHPNDSSTSRPSTVRTSLQSKNSFSITSSLSRARTGTETKAGSTSLTIQQSTVRNSTPSSALSTGPKATLSQNSSATTRVPSSAAGQNTQMTSHVMSTHRSVLPSTHPRSTRTRSTTGSNSKASSPITTSTRPFSTALSGAQTGKTITTHSTTASVPVETVTTNSSTALVPITVIPVSKGGTTSHVTYISTRTSFGSIGPTGVWMCTGSLCDPGSGCIIPIFCKSQSGSSSSWGLCCGWTPPSPAEGVLPAAGGPIPGPPESPDTPSGGGGSKPSGSNTDSSTKSKKTGSSTKSDKTDSSTKSETSTCSRSPTAVCDTTVSIFTPSGRTRATTTTITGDCQTITVCSKTVTPKITTKTASCSIKTTSQCDISYSVFTPSGKSTASTSTITGLCTTISACTPTITANTTTITANPTMLDDSVVIGDSFLAHDPEAASWYDVQQSILAEAMADTTDPIVYWSSGMTDASSNPTGSTGTGKSTTTSSSTHTKATTSRTSKTSLVTDSTSTTGRSSKKSTTSQHSDTGQTTSAHPTTTHKTTTSHKTTEHSTSTPSSPRITSCKLTTEGRSVIGSLTIEPTQYCTCNDGWMAALGSTIGNDKKTTYTCEVSTTFMPMSTGAASLRPSTTSRSGRHSGKTTATHKSSTSSKGSSTSSTAPKPLESCHTQYAVYDDGFDIYGFDWDQSKLDGDGSYMTGLGLLKQLRGCSVVTNWTFENQTVTSSQPYQWHASGLTTIWQKNCIEHAMISAGSPSTLCSGTG